MWFLCSLLSFWLAATAVGLPLLDSPEDIWPSELDRGFGGPKRHREVVPRLHLQDHPPATAVETVLGHSQSRLRKRGIRQAIGAIIHNHKLRNRMWSSRSMRRCMRRKRREFDKIHKTKYNRVEWEHPSEETLSNWRKICSTWESAYLDTKDRDIGESIKETQMRKRKEQIAKDIAKTPRATWYTPEDIEQLPDTRVRDFDPKNAEPMNPDPDPENDNGDNDGRPDGGTLNFADVGSDLIEQAWSYVRPREGGAGMARPGVPGRSFMTPIHPPMIR